MDKKEYKNDGMFSSGSHYSFDSFCKNLLDKGSIFGVGEKHITIPYEEDMDLHVDNIKEAIFSLSSEIPKSSLYKKLYKFSKEKIDENFIKISVIYRV